MIDIVELLTKLRAEEQDLRDQARSYTQQACMIQEHIRGIEVGRDLTLAATQAPVKDKAKAEPEPEPSEQPRRERRNVRGLVYAELADAKRGVTVDELIKKLDAAKSSIVSALAYHEANDDASLADSGRWFANPGGKWAADKVSEPTASAQSNGEDGDIQDGPPSVVDVIRAAGEDGITDKELAASGYQFASASVVKAKNDGEVKIQDGRIYAIDDPER